jgi:hypothetical protein
MARITVIVYMAWWFRFYAWGVVATVFLTGCEPDMVKVGKVALRAVRYRFSDS